MIITREIQPLTGIFQYFQPKSSYYSLKKMHSQVYCKHALCSKNYRPTDVTVVLYLQFILHQLRFGERSISVKRRHSKLLSLYSMPSSNYTV